MENIIELEVLGLSSSQSQTGSFALVLGEKQGNRRLPIIIGMAEAQAIAIEIESIKPNRPFTHDLFKSFATSFNIHVEKIMISNIKEGVFYATMICSDGIQTVELDARPSDAIALGLRFNVPIFSYENILSDAGIILTEEEEEPTNETNLEPVEEAEDIVDLDEAIQQDEGHLNEYSSQQLQILLDDALASEDYEQAARVRDEINKRSSN